MRNVSFAVQVLTLLGEVIVHFYTRTAGVPIAEAPGVGRGAVRGAALPAARPGSTR